MNKATGSDKLEEQVKDILGHCMHWNESCWYQDTVERLRKEEKDEDVVDRRLSDEQEKAINGLLREARILGGIEELKRLQSKRDAKPKDTWYKDPLPKQLKELEAQLNNQNPEVKI